MYLIPILGVMAFGFLAMGINALKLSFSASATPATLTCAGFAKNGPGDNAHVNLTSTVLSARHVRHIERSDGVEETWVPAFPNGRSYEDSRVLVKLSKLLPGDMSVKLSDASVQKLRAVSAGERWVRAVDSAAEMPLHKLRGKKVSELIDGSLADLWAETIEAEWIGNTPIFTAESVRGVVLNGLEDPSAKVVEGLREVYPWLEMDDLLFVEAGRRPISRLFSISLVVVGGLLAVWVLWSLVSAYSRRAAARRTVVT